MNHVTKYMNSKLVTHRIALLREIPDYYVKNRSLEYYKQFGIVLKYLVGDVEPLVRQGIAELVPLLVAYCNELVGVEDALKDEFTESILATLTYLMKDKQVRERAFLSFLEILPKLRLKFIEEKIFSIVETFANDQEDEDSRVEVGPMLAVLSPLIGKQLTLSFSIRIIKQLATDTMFRVRKSIVNTLVPIAKVLGEEEVDNVLLPVFVGLCGDEVWGVRKASCEALPGISGWVEKEKRKGMLLPLYEKLAEDKSRWVKNAAGEVLSPFLCTFPKGGVPENLLNAYKAMATSEPKKLDDSGDPNEDPLTIIATAFNFPGVLITIGVERWAELKETYQLLLKNPHWKVRRTLSFSFQAVSELLGTRGTEEHLLPALDLFLHDLDEVKVGVLSVFVKVLRVLSPDVRKNYLTVLEELNKPKGNWRFRKIIAKQLGDLSELFSIETVALHILPVALKLQLDPVASVRKALIPQFCKIIRNLFPTTPSPSITVKVASPIPTSPRTPSSLSPMHSSPSPRLSLSPEAAANPLSDRGNLTPTRRLSPSTPGVRSRAVSASKHQQQMLDDKKDETLNFLKSLPKSSIYNHRTVFCYLSCYAMNILEKKFFEEHFLIPLLCLVDDTVISVRWAVAQALSKISENEMYSADERVKAALQSMMSQKDISSFKLS
uniref:Phosphatase 2A Regulatory Subunit A helical domain-containing protein n=1 Tax=Arcella intermedia TaxID=1963864 RepID=A0A6B2KZM6_9EUKA